SNDLMAREAAARTGPVTTLAPRVEVAAADLVNVGTAGLAATAAPVYAPYRRKVRRSIPRFSVGPDRSSITPSLSLGKAESYGPMAPFGKLGSTRTSGDLARGRTEAYSVRPAPVTLVSLPA